MRPIHQIIVSGGWGFGNIGDDAILLATIKLLRNYFPDAKIIILSCDALDSQKVLYKTENVEVIPDLYKTLWGEYNFPIRSLKSQIIARIRSKIGYDRMHSKHTISRYLSSPDEYHRKATSQIKLLKMYFLQSQLYFLSGGGYLNDWYQEAIVKDIETSIAKEQNVRCLTFGQTIGEFSSKSEEIVKRIISRFEKVVFRDEQSIYDAKVRWNLKNVYEKSVPDIALSDLYKTNKENKIVCIPFNYQLEKHCDTFIEAMTELQHVSGNEIVVAVSQLWYGQIGMSFHLYSQLQKRGLDVKYFIPNNIHELQQLLGSASCVISQNLHGLICAYRADVPIICLNDKRKFLSFMKQIGEDCSLIPPSCLQRSSFVDVVTRPHQHKGDDIRNSIIASFEALLR